MQPKMARLASKTSILPFPVVDRCDNRPKTGSSSSAWSKTADLPLELKVIVKSKPQHTVLRAVLVFFFFTDINSLNLKVQTCVLLL